MIFSQRGHTAQNNTTDRTPPLKRVFTLRLSLASLLGIGLVALIGVGWAFAFGMIIGRGFEPEQKLPVLGRLTPQPQTEAPQENSEIIKAEELTFMADLKSHPTLSTEQPAPSETKSAEAAKTGTPKQADAGKSTQGKTADAAKTGQTKAQTPPQGKPQSSTPTPPAPAAAGGQTYNFVFQVIAYKKPEQAEAFRDKLENAGLRTRLQVEKDKQGKPRTYSLQVLIKGTDADADAARAIMARHGAKDPVIRSRKPL